MDAQKRKEMFEEANRRIREVYDGLEEAGAITSPMPVGRVTWVPVVNVRANDYNPNAVALREMTLLYTSISEDGYTQPVVVIEDEENPGHYVIVDGFHRYTTMRRYEDIAAITGGYLPVVILEKSLKDRIASTVRHNRARGKHSVEGMGNLVFQMLQEGESDAVICRKLGLEREELARLKHVTGYSKLYKDHEYTHAVLTNKQMKAKADYKKEHPDEHVPAV